MIPGFLDNKAPSTDNDTSDPTSRNYKAPRGALGSLIVSRSNLTLGTTTYQYHYQGHWYQHVNYPAPTYTVVYMNKVNNLLYFFINF